MGVYNKRLITFLYITCVLLTLTQIFLNRFDHLNEGGLFLLYSFTNVNIFYKIKLQISVRSA